MRYFVSVVILVALAGAANVTKPTGTFTQSTIVTADGNRTYALYVPLGGCSSLFTFLHGTLADAQFNAQPYALKAQLEAIADDPSKGHPCILWPLAMENLATGTHYWNADGACITFGATCPDDLGFIAAVVELVQAQYNISPGQTFVSGMSSGGYMTQAIGDHRPDLVAAIAPVSGAQYISPAGYQFVSPILPSPVSVLRSQGPGDPVVPGCGGTKTFWNRTLAASPSMDADFAYWTTQNVTTVTNSQLAQFSKLNHMLDGAMNLCTNGVPTPGLLSLDATGGIGNSEVLFVWQWDYPAHQWPTKWENVVWYFFQTHSRTQ